MNDPTVRTYIISPTLVPGTNLPAFEQYLKDSQDILGYWNYIPLLYCVKSRLPSQQLSIKVSPFFLGQNFLVAELSLYNINGALPQAAWDWFYTNHVAKEGSAGGIQGLLTHFQKPG